MSFALGAREVGIVVMSLIDERLERNRLRLERGRARTGNDSASSWNVRHRSAVLNSMGDFESELLPIGSVLRVLRFGGVS